MTIGNSTMHSRCNNKRRVMAVLLTLAATAMLLAQTASASVITNDARGGVQSSQRDMFENADHVPMLRRESASESSEHAGWISKALILAGTYSPSVSTIAGKPTTTTTSTVKTTSTTVKTSSTVVKTTSTTVKTISATAKVISSTAKTTSTTAKTTSTTAKTSSTTAKTTSTTAKTTATVTACAAKTTSSTAKTTSTTAKTTSTTSLKATASAKSATTTAKTTSTSSIKTTGNFPTAAATTSAKTTAKTTSTTTTKPKTQTWSWAAAAYGCGTATPSGKFLMCYATGTARPNKRAILVEPTAAPFSQREDEEVFNFVKRANSNDDTPDLGWLDTIVGAVPYRSGDLASSIVWIVMTLLLIPLFVIRLLRRSSLIAHVLFCVFIWACTMVAAFGIRTWMAASTPTTSFMLAENVLLQVLPCLLLEPLFSLLAMYSAQGQVKSGVPSVCMLLRVVNLAALALFAVTAAFTGMYLEQWDRALMSTASSGAQNAFPAELPAAITQLGPIIGSFMVLAVIAGGLLLIPVARGANGSMRPGAFLAALFTLVGISVAYRILQTLHARDVLSSEANAGSSSDVVSTTLLQLASSSMVNIADIAPPGMYSSGISGIAWSKLQSSMASRGSPQTPLLFNLVYIFPMWLQVFLLFFVHAPAGGDQSANSAKAKVAALEASA